MDAIWFHAVERKDVVPSELAGEEREWAAVPELNRFRGQLTPTLRVRDWRMVSGKNRGEKNRGEEKNLGEKNSV